MAMKDFQFKEFLIQHGEKVGLGVAVAVMVVCLATGALAALGHESPDETAGQLQTLTKRIQQNIQAGGTAGGQKTTAAAGLDNGEIDPSKYNSDQKLSWSSTGITQGRNEPKILNTVDLDAIPFRCQVKAFDYDGQHMRVFIGAGGSNDYADKIKGLQKAPPLRRPGMVGGPTPAKGPPGKGQATTIQSVRPDQMPPGAKPVSVVLPTRMVIVTGSFPYEEQTENYRRALHCTTQQLKEENLLPTVQAIIVERRTLDETGKETEAWRKLNFEEDYRPINDRSLANQPEDPELMPLQAYFDMVCVRPLLMHGDYPPMSDKLKVKEYLRSLVGKEEKQLDFVPPAREKPREVGALFGSGAKAPKDPIKPPPGDKKPDKQPKPAAGKDKKPELVIPKFIPVRFCDVTVRPGFTYQYRMKVRMTNPNFGKKDKVAYESLATEKPELESPKWGPTDPVTVTVSPELFHYATDPDSRFLKDKPGFVPVQVHRWVESTRAMDDKEVFQVGEWAIANIAVRRGEHVGRTGKVEMPIWMADRDRYDFPTPQIKRAAGMLVAPRVGPRGISVDFESQTILVDWEGGHLVHSIKIGPKANKDIKEEAAVEILLLSPEGKLQLRNSKIDFNNFERDSRLKAWEINVKDAINQIMNPGATETKPGTKPMPGTTPMPGTKPMTKPDFFTPKK